MRFGGFYEHQLPKPWSDDDEFCLLRDALDLLATKIAAVVDRAGGQTAFFVNGAEATEADLIAFARERLAGFKTPKHVVFQELPKTSTGKIQKYVLRDRAREIATGAAAELMPGA